MTPSGVIDVIERLDCVNPFIKTIFASVSGLPSCVEKCSPAF